MFFILVAQSFQDESTAARLSCSNCLRPYYLHNLQPPPTDSAVPSSSAPPSSAVPPSSGTSAPLSSAASPSFAPSWMTMGTFCNASTSQVTQERMRHAQPPASSTPSTASSFRQWGLDSFSAESTATVNDRRVSAAQRHQPAPHGLPVPARGVAQSPLHLLPTITLPRVTRTAAHSALRNPRSQFGAQASSSQTYAPKTVDYKFACVILPIGVSQFIAEKVM